MSFKFNESNNKSKALKISFVVILALYSITGVFYYEEVMEKFMYLLIISRFFLIFGILFNFISLIDVVERMCIQNNKKISKKFWLLIAIAIDIFYCIIEERAFHINFLALKWFEIIHEFLAIMVVPVCPISILLAIYFRHSIHSSFKGDITSDYYSKNIEKSIETYLSGRVLARRIARKFILSSMCFSVWSSFFLFYFRKEKNLKFSQLLSDGIIILPAIFVLAPLVYVLFNLYYSAEELDDLRLIKLKMLRSSCHEFQSNITRVLKLLEEAELKPDFMESLFFPAVINLLIAYLPTIF